MKEIKKRKKDNKKKGEISLIDFGVFNGDSFHLTNLTQLKNNLKSLNFRNQTPYILKIDANYIPSCPKLI